MPIVLGFFSVQAAWFSAQHACRDETAACCMLRNNGVMRSLPHTTFGFQRVLVSSIAVKHGLWWTCRACDEHVALMAFSV